MARIKRGSRRMALLAAFLSVMAGAGGLMGAVAGAVMVLLFRSIFNMSTGIVEFVSALVFLGALLTSVLGVMLAAPGPMPALVRVREVVPSVSAVPGASPDVK